MATTATPTRDDFAAMLDDMFGAADSFEGRVVHGTVTAIDKAAGTITLDHGPIPEAKWPAMTMAFKAAPSITDAVKVAKAADRITVIHVETDPRVYAPDSHSWWDVPVSQVSALESTRHAYQRYTEWKKVQRPLIAPSDD